MRDPILLAVVMAICIASLKRPWIGALGWVWLGIMNPHRYVWGFASTAPLSQAVALCFFVGILATRNAESPLKGPPVTWTVLFFVWLTLSWLLGVDVDGHYDQWNKVLKIFGMTWLILAVLHSKQHIIALAWVYVLSIGLLAAKGGVYTISTGGGGRVFGPPGSLIGDNNEFALAVVITIPVMWFLWQQLQSKWGKRAMVLMMVLSALTVLGSQSRGGFLAILAMALMLWLRGGKFWVGGIVLGVVGLALVAFMPDEWTQRMQTIDDYRQDASSMNRISAWWTAFGVARDNFFGAGMHFSYLMFFKKYSPYPDSGVWAAHSIYFQMLGNHGFVGLALFVGMYVSTWRLASKVIKLCKGDPNLLWCKQLMSMCQVALLGYAVGGAFLSLAYLDLPIYLLSMVVLVHQWVQRKAWLTEPSIEPSRWTLPGLLGPKKAKVST